MLQKPLTNVFALRAGGRGGGGMSCGLGEEGIGVSRGCIAKVGNERVCRHLGVGKNPAAFLLAKVGSRESDIFGYRTAG